MDKNSLGKGAGIGGAVAVIIAIICQLTHNGGIPWVKKKNQKKMKVKILLIL